jgi:hypothetical protein
MRPVGVSQLRDSRLATPMIAVIHLNLSWMFNARPALHLIVPLAAESAALVFDITLLELTVLLFCVTCYWQGRFAILL